MSNFAATAPLYINRVGLRSADALRLANFYKDLLGLEDIRHSANHIHLGVAGHELLVIEEDRQSIPDNEHEAGLFHVAFLMPNRRELAKWLIHAVDHGFSLHGASDHDVSEAFYLSDLDGNGIEIYADRPQNTWQWHDGTVKMRTFPLEMQSLMTEIANDDGSYQAPDGLMIGHTHLRVGSVIDAENWWHGTLGFDAVQHYGDKAVFLSTGGYHHHIGANVWASRGAGLRPKHMAGLNFVELKAQDKGKIGTRHDPWGLEVRIV